jgi:hypothetical protein
MISHITTNDPVLIRYRPLTPRETGSLRCFCHRPATWEKTAGDVSSVFCDRHWHLWRHRFEADPGPCHLVRCPSPVLAR